MKLRTIILKSERIEFEVRMFISLFIIFFYCTLSHPVFKGEPNNIQIILEECFNLRQDIGLTSGYILISLLLIMASLLRMWSGSKLTSHRIMAFKVQKDQLITTGPFTIVRNPIYLADFIAYCAFTLCLQPVALTMPFIILIHYLRLIKYEEKSLETKFGSKFTAYKSFTPHRIFPSLKNPEVIVKALKTFSINYDGFRNNAPYLLFIPGFIIAAIVGDFRYAFFIGMPLVLDWAIIHTYKGLRNDSE